MGQLGLTVLRLVVGLVFVVHGWRKVMVGLDQVSESFAGHGIPLPVVSAVLATLAEFVGGVLLVAGFKTRLAAIPPAIVMVVAMVTVHLRHGFFLPKGFEYTLVLLAALVTLLLSGPGLFSVDGLLRKRAAGREEHNEKTPGSSVSGIQP